MPQKRNRSATPPPAELEQQLKASLRRIWAWEESNGRKPDIETIFDFLNIDKSQRYELLKSEFVRTMSSQAREKPEEIDIEAPQEETLKIKVVHNNLELYYNLKQNTQMSRLFNDFCDRQGRHINSVRFLYKGTRMSPFVSPETLDMVDGDVIEVHNEQG